MNELVGETLSRYKILALLGEGGMGAVFRALDPALQQERAIKVMHSHLLTQDPSFEQRFLQEARAAARLDHPGVVRVLDYGQDRGYTYIVMEFLRGDNLRQLLKDLKAAGEWITLPEAVGLVRQLCLTVDYIHHQGVLHRDLKTDNIMLKAEPCDGLPYRPVITDLGLAKLLEGGLQTTMQTSMGTPAYMSPEQALGQAVDARSDVYSLGIVLYELAVGKLPFRINSITEAIRYHTREAPPPPRSVRPDLPADLEQAILTALQKNPAQRYASAAAMAQALDNLLPKTAESASTRTVAGESVSLDTQFRQSLLEKGAIILVITPDGTTDTHAIIQPMVTIGSSPDNVLVLKGSAIAAHHAVVGFDGADFTVTDLRSASGTFLADVRLLPDVTEKWSGGRVLRIGDYQLNLQRESKPVPPPPPPRPGAAVAVQLETPQLSLELGSNALGSLSVMNQGELVDQLQVTVQGIPASWLAAIDPVRLLPGERQQVTFTIQPPRSPQSKAGTRSITLRATSRNDPAQFAEATGTVTLAPYYQWSCEMRPQKQSSVQAGCFQLQLRNAGNTPLTVQFTARDPEDGCVYDFRPSPAAVPAGEEASVDLTVSSRQRRSRRARTYPFTVTATPLEAPDLVQRLTGEWQQLPKPLQLWRLLLAVLAGALAFGLTYLVAVLSHCPALTCEDFEPDQVVAYALGIGVYVAVAILLLGLVWWLWHLRKDQPR